MQLPELTSEWTSGILNIFLHPIFQQGLHGVELEGESAEEGEQLVLLTVATCVLDLSFSWLLCAFSVPFLVACWHH